jgi:hypothetical protein
VFLLLLKIFFILTLSGAIVDEEKYGPDSPPPETGWKSALKFFSKDENQTTASRATASDSDAIYDQYLSLDNTVILNSEASSSIEPKGRFGLHLGYVWDHASWLSQGVYLQYSDMQPDRRYSLLSGLVFPGIETEFPLFLKATAGLGYFVGDFKNDTLTLDYAASVGLRIFSQNRFMFQMEFGSQNYHRLLEKSYANSWVLSSGLAFIF